MKLFTKNIVLILFQLYQLYQLSFTIDGHYLYPCLNREENISHIEIINTANYDIDSFKDANLQSALVKDHTNKEYKYKGKTLDKIFKARNIYMVEIDMDTFPSFFDGYNKTFMLFCPLHYYKVEFNKHEEFLPKDVLYLTYIGPAVCSLKICEIGIYYGLYYIPTKNDIHDSIDKDVFFVVFNSKKKEKDIIFGTYSYDGLRYPLIPCPYKNWTLKSDLSKFSPSNYVINDGISIDYKLDYERHKLVPGMPMSKDNTIHYCGTIDQHNFNKINIGIKLKSDKHEITYDKIEIIDAGIRCHDNNIYSKYIYSFILDNINYNGNKKEIKKIDPIKSNFYSGHHLLVYDEKDIESDISNNTIINDYGKQLHEDYFNKRHGIKPKCIGMINDIKATLKIKINGEIIKYDKKINEINFMKIDVKSDVNELLSAECYAFVDSDNDIRFKDFYNLRYKFELFKGKLSELDGLNKLNIINISSPINVKSVFGYYNCRMKKDKINDYINEAEFIVLPKNQLTIIEPIKNISSSRSLICQKNYANLGNLSVIKVEFSSGKQLNNIESPSNFIENQKSIEFKKIEDYNNNSLIVICEYDVFGEPFVLLKKMYVYNNKEIITQVQSTNNTKLLISVIVAIILLIITIIVSVIIIVRKKSKKRRMKKLSNSQSSSQSNSKSTSKSISKLNSRITSTSNTTESSQVLPKVKVPILLDSQSDTSMSSNVSNSKDICNKNRIKLVAKNMNI